MKSPQTQGSSDAVEAKTEAATEATTGGVTTATCCCCCPGGGGVGDAAGRISCAATAAEEKKKKETKQRQTEEKREAARSLPLLLQLLPPPRRRRRPNRDIPFGVPAILIFVVVSFSARARFFYFKLKKGGERGDELKRKRDAARSLPVGLYRLKSSIVLFFLDARRLEEFRESFSPHLRCLVEVTEAQKVANTQAKGIFVLATTKTKMRSVFFSSSWSTRDFSVRTLYNSLCLFLFSSDSFHVQLSFDAALFRRKCSTRMNERKKKKKKKLRSCSKNARRD